MRAGARLANNCVWQTVCEDVEGGGGRGPLTARDARSGRAEGDKGGDGVPRTEGRGWRREAGGADEGRI
jgi:hypothetical protein